MRLKQLAAAAVLTSSAALHAQTATATVAGHVVDPQGKAVPDASVTVRNTDLSTARTVKTDVHGNFRIAGLTSGAFTVEVQSTGMATRRPIRLTLTLASTAHLDIALALPSVRQSTTVRARAANVEGNTVAPDVNKEDPSVGIFLPGLTVTYLPNRDRDFNQFVELTPGAEEDASGNGVIIAGQRASAVAVEVDGTSFNDPRRGGERGAEDRGFFLPQTVVREFQVLHAAVSAEVGETTAGLINIVTKQGSGKLHGEFFYTGRPAQLTSTDAFGHSLANTQNNFGGSSGGPFGGRLKNKAFYYAGFEQDILHVPYWVQFQPQAAGVAIPAALQGLQNQVVQSSTPSAFFGRIDLTPTAKDVIALELGLNRVHATNLPDALNTGASTRSFATADNSALLGGHSATGIAQWMHLLRPNLVNQANIAWSGDHRALTPNSTAAEQVINGFGILGGNSFGSQLWTSQQTQIRDDLSRTHGSTVISFGGAFGYDPAYDQQEQNLAGRFDYNSLTDFLNNNPRRFQQTFAAGSIRYQGAVRELSLYANGRWTLREGLSLTAGLRWGMQVNPQPQHPNAAIPVTASVPTDHALWQPRIGLAWNPVAKTVVRVSGGLFDAATPADTFQRAATENGQQVIVADSYFDPLALALAEATGTPQALASAPRLTVPAALVVGVAPGFRNPASAQFAASVEQQTVFKLDLTLGYVHNSTWHLAQRLDANLNPPAPSASGEPLFGVRPNPALGRVLVNGSTSHSSYDGMLFTAVAQVSRRTTITGNYTVATTRSDSDFEGPFSIDSTLNQLNPHADAGPSTQDVRQNLNVAAILNLPAGLKFNPVLIARSGLPYTPLIGFDTQHDANDWNDRVVTAAGPVGRNSQRQPGLTDLDLRVVKDFTLKGEGHHLDLFMDVFNVGGASNRWFGPGSFSIFGNGGATSLFSAGQALFAPDTTRLGGAREFQFTARLVGF